jgi:hypothetical protein
VQAVMGANTVTFTENFYDILGQPGIYLAFYVLKRHRIILAIYADMVVVLDRGDLPCGELIRSFG